MCADHVFFPGRGRGMANYNARGGNSGVGYQGRGNYNNVVSLLNEVQAILAQVLLL